MISLTLLILISAIIILVGLFLLAVGGSLCIIIFADIIVALGIIWFIFLKRTKKD